ncbi:MAG: shikimate dehydrogenase [Burkholderiaceae bacterium]|nr:shikimate dehydrogenase [Burkholderiaceae bacterium]
MPAITGTTQLFAILADPIAQVRTPEVLNDYFAQQGINGVLVPMQVPADKLSNVFQTLRAMKNLQGFVVTVPHKTDAAALCDELGDTGNAIGAINTVRRTADGRLVGDMLDGVGFLNGLKEQGHDPAGKRVLLLGAGGAAAAIAFALVQDGVASLTVFNRTLARAQELVDRTKTHFPNAVIQAAEPAADKGYDLVINATSLGMKPEDPYPLDPAYLEPSMVVAEIIMKPEQTPLLLAAQEKGCVVHYGRHMLDQQIRLMAQFMMGKDQ